MATDPQHTPSLDDVYHLVSLMHEELKLVKSEITLTRHETQSLQRQFSMEAATNANNMASLFHRFDAIERDIATLFRHVVGGEES